MSFFIGICSILIIVSPFPITLVIYRDIIGITNLSPMHSVIIFIVLGISTNGVMVMWDAWTQSKKIR